MYKVIVREWMKNYTEFMDENSFLVQNNACEMPMTTMFGDIIEETEKMLKMKLHCDICNDNIYCMNCGRELKNNISKYLGIGPECGKHYYNVDINTLEDIKQNEKFIKETLHNIKWEGWIPKSAILELKDLSTNETIDTKPKIKIQIRIDKAVKCYEDKSIFVSFTYNSTILEIIKSQNERYYNPTTKEWELPFTILESLKEQLKNYDIDIINSYDNAYTSDLTEKTYTYIPKDYKFKITPFKHQIEGIEYGLNNDRFILADEQRLG